jgi:cytidylate kinase
VTVVDAGGYTRPVTLITLSAPYGAGGSQVGPAVARRLGVPFVDRAIPTGVAERLSVPLDDAVERDESVGGPLTRMSVWLGQVGQAFGAPEALPVHAVEETDYRRATEEVLREHARGDGAVILGRGGAIVLRDEPGALHVRLDGPEDARIHQGMAVEGVDRQTAERHIAETDKARRAYLQHFYRCDPREASLYHLVIDSTAIDLDACTEMIVTAARARERTAAT